MLHRIDQRTATSDRFATIRKAMYGREIKYISDRLYDPLFEIQFVNNRLNVSISAKSRLKLR